MKRSLWERALVRENRRMKRTQAILLFLCLCLTAPAWSAWDFNKSIREKQAQKNAKRWSLSEWLDQKGRNKLMDMWLMYNTPSPYEFFFSADTSNVEQEVMIGTGTPTSQTFRNYRGAFGAFVTVVGLYGEYESSDEELEQWKALFMVRLLGSSDQSTNFTIHYGLMNQNFNDEETQYQVGGGRISLYLIKAFALTGQYEHIFEAESEQNNITSEGSRWEAGAHLEYGALRIYGSWFQEVLDLTTTTNQESQRTRQGLLYGLRFYF